MTIQRTIAITNAHFAGNKGANAMVRSLCDVLAEQQDRTYTVQFLSVYPQEDRAENPYPFLECVPATPQKVLFKSFPMALLYTVFRPIGFIKKKLSKDPVLRAFLSADLSVDMAGVSYADSRGVVMNVYGFVLNAIPMLLGVPVLKYSQALGPFHNPVNRLLAKLILPKLKCICSRGALTTEYLKGIHVQNNVVECADSAFSMRDRPEITEAVARMVDSLPIFKKEVIAVSLSSVVNKKCSKSGIDYQGIMTEFIRFLMERGYGVMLIANAARQTAETQRNNDLPLCRTIKASFADDDRVLFIDKEMEPEEIREYISHCRALIGSRFHAMIAAYAKCVPVLLIGWSHKYQEVSRMLGVDRYAQDYHHLDLSALKSSFIAFDEDNAALRATMKAYLPSVLQSSKQNMALVLKTVDEVAQARPLYPLDFRHPERYLGAYVATGKGYDSDWSDRSFCASGGLVTCMLAWLIEQGRIDGAVVSRQVMESSHASACVEIVTEPAQVLLSGSSIYTPVPVLQCLDKLRTFPGRVAVVATPCIASALRKMMASDPVLNEKVAYIFGLFCGGVLRTDAIPLLLKKQHIPTDSAERLIFKTGLWRGQSRMLYRGGAETPFSYKKTFFCYKNAYFFEPTPCSYCTDHFAVDADISFGDVWLKQEKGKSVKQTGYVVRNAALLDVLSSMQSEHRIKLASLSPDALMYSQKRPLHYKVGLQPLKRSGDVRDNCGGYGLQASVADWTFRPRWKHRLAWRVTTFNKHLSETHPDWIMRMPVALIYGYMAFVRLLLN